MKTALFLLLLPALCCAQEFEFQLEPEAFPVEIAGWSPFCPWAGGFTETHPTFCDIDSDGDLDFFVGEYLGKPIPYFENQGNESMPDFTWRGALSDSMCAFDNESRTSPDFYDLDADGDLDILIGCGYVTYVENIWTSTQPDFNSPRIQLFDTNGDWIFGSHVALCDIDCDGDADLIGGEYQGHLQFYRNVGTPDSFSYYLEDDHWLGISVGNGQDADPTFCDLDADGDLDLFIGEEQGNIWYYRNDGDSANYNFTYVTNNFENINVGSFNSPEFADVDGDVDYDLFVGNEDYDPYFYENVGTPQSPQFELVTGNYLTMDFNLISPTPQVVDINADGALDLIIASSPGMPYFQNVGTSTNPNYHLIENAFQGISLPGIFPAFVDIDADGDLDIIAGDSVIPVPTVALYLNQGTPQHPHFVLYSSSFIANSDFHVNANPGVADIDADGDYDLFISGGQGKFYYYQNNGTPQWPDYDLYGEQWQGIQFYYPNYGWKGFYFADLDGDSDYDLLIEDQSCYKLNFYRNIGTPQVANMVLEINDFLPQFTGLYPNPFPADVDLDGDLDLFCGEFNGGMLFFRNVTGEVSVSPHYKQPSPYQGPVFTLGSNPANPSATINLFVPSSQRVSLAIYNLLGQRVSSLVEGIQDSGFSTYVWDASQAASGVYLVRLQTPQGASTQKFTVLK